MRIRGIEARDKDEWLRMRYALWPHGDIHEHAREIDAFFVNHSELATFVSERGEGGLNGFVEAAIRSYAEECESRRVGYIEGWYVDADARQHGIGRALIEASEGWAVSQGCTEMASDTEIANLVSQVAHLRLGYREAGRLIHFMKKLQED
jgi:aminoglycoside 6'-N-acetyltransferase I